jgi:hypothetical protein
MNSNTKWIPGANCVNYKLHSQFVIILTEWEVLHTYTHMPEFFLEILRRGGKIDPKARSRPHKYISIVELFWTIMNVGRLICICSIQTLKGSPLGPMTL